MRNADKPDIETSGISARFYDQLVFIGTFGLYHRLLKRVIEAMDIQPEDHILDMGTGTGKVALLIYRYLEGGSITALEIGREMRKQFRHKCGEYSNIFLENLRIDEPLPFREQFDKVFISYGVENCSSSTGTSSSFRRAVRSCAFS
jgi:demethylmenaquinone methyltransferase/2-methoxy-6-polyprenyl-1,4-benzoquinol methylase